MSKKMYQSTNEILLLVLCLTPLAICTKDSLEVQIELGKIRGHTVSTVDGKSVDAFLGIPYGATTGKTNRFSPPKEPSAWDGVFEATKFSSPCFQGIAKEQKEKMWFASQNEESETCLALNIWVPRPRPKSTGVLVWIHGGGFSVGSTDVALYNGATLAANENVIVVSLNYRLSAFGFLYLEHPLAPGNMGMMDQAMGLQWVQKYIRAFGGDPNRVTIFGESSGGAVVGLHLLAPTSLDLFQNAILMSGAPSCDWATVKPDYALQQSLIFAENAGCPVKKDEREDTIKCLQRLSAQEILDAALKIDDSLMKMIFIPVVDGAYLPASPSQLLATDKFCTEKKVMIGITKDDGSFFIPSFKPQLTKNDKSDYTEQELKKIISLLMHGQGEIPDLAVELISHLYSEWNPDSQCFNISLDGVVRSLTDRWFGCGSHTTSDRLAKKGNSVYFYRFDYEPKAAKRGPSWIGATHTDELPFLFGGKLNSGSEEVKLAKQIMRYWSNFAKSGDPNDVYLPVWPKYTYQEKMWLHLDSNNITVNRADKQKECTFWENIFPKLELFK